jgi:hypothetical protein
MIPHCFFGLVSALHAFSCNSNISTNIICHKFLTHFIPIPFPRTVYIYSVLKLLFWHLFSLFLSSCYHVWPSHITVGWTNTFCNFKYVLLDVLLSDNSVYSPWIRILFEKPVVTDVVKNVPAFMELEDTLTCSSVLLWTLFWAIIVQSTFSDRIKDPL